MGQHDRGSARRRRATSFAKTTRPRLADVVVRERLFSLLDERRRASLVWVHGPPGSGKTTLVASYLEARGPAVSWYQLDAGDADVGTFFYYMGTAAGGGGEVGLDLFTAEYRGDLGAFSRRYARRLYARLEPPFVVVLDNYQELPSGADLDTVIEHAVAELPEDGSLMILSRSEPPASMARLRANRTLEVVGWSDIRLTRAESDAIASARDLALDEAALERLYARTQGWAAGLVLMLAETGEPGEAGRVADPDAPQVVFDYLAGEVFETFDAATRQLLLRTADLPEFTDAMARELTGEARAAELLAAVHRSYRLVSQQADGAELVYQYHPMLREFLLARAAAVLPARERRALRRRSADLLRGAGRVDASLALLADAGDLRELARALVEAAPELLGHGRADTLQAAIERLPDALVDDEPWLLYWLATCRFHATPREARILYGRAFAAFPADSLGPWLACSGAMDAIIYELDDLTALDAWIETGQALVERHGEPADENAAARFAASMFMSLVFRQPWHADVTEWAQRTYQRLDAIDDASARLTAQLLLAINLNYTGQFAKARDFVAGMRRLCESPNVPPAALTVLKDVESMHYAFTADPERCVSAVYDGLEIAQASGVDHWTYHILSNGVAGALAAGDVDTARELLARMREHSASARRLDRAIFHYCAGWLATLRGDSLEAFQELKTALRLAVECGCPFYEILCRLALAPVCIECGDLARAAVELRRARRIARGIDNRLLDFAGLLGYAHIALTHGRPRSGLGALRHAMGVGREHGLNHFLGWRPQTMAALCERALAEDIEPDYVRWLIRDRGLTPRVNGVRPAEWPWPLRVQTLGEFRVTKDDRPLEEQVKVQKRPMELLGALVALGAENVHEGALGESLWPRIDADSAHRSLTTALFRLRKMLGEDGAVVLRHGRLSLDAGQCWLDVLELEGAAATIEARAGEPAEAGDVADLARRLFSVYRGPFMAGESDHPRYAAPRERLRNRFLRALGGLAGMWEALDRPGEVPSLYERAIEVEPLSETLYRRLMLCYRALGRQAEAIEAFERCAALLRAERGAEPSPETRAIYERAVGEL